MSTYCFVYTSVSKHKWADDDLNNLLNKSRHKNASHNISGMLLYLDPFFIQILEGEEQLVNELFNTIKQDPRHYKVSLIYKKPIEERSFADWSMGFNVLNKEKIANIKGFSDFLENPPPQPSPIHHEIDRLLTMFKNETLF
jgi:Sensors of blue-light using FAD